MQSVRVIHPELDFSVDVRLRRWEGGWVAEADFAGKRDIGVGRERRTAFRRALAPLGERRAEEMADRPIRVSSDD